MHYQKTVEFLDTVVRIIDLYVYTDTYIRIFMRHFTWDCLKIHFLPCRPNIIILITLAK